MFIVNIARAAGDCHVFVLKDSDSGVTLEAVRLSEGVERVFGADEVITVVLPFGIGMSGDLIQPEDRTGTIGVTCEGGVIHTVIKKEGKQPRSLPDVSLADAEELDIRVNVTTGAGEKKAFRVRAFGEVEPSSGPVIDMFGGAVPLSEGSYSITSEVAPTSELPGLSGEIPFVVRDGAMIVEVSIDGGPTAGFVIDFGASGTVVARDILPEGTAIEPVVAVEHSAEGSRELPGGMTGAGGDVGGFAGAAMVNDLKVGKVDVGETSVSVVDRMSVFSDESIAGVLGLDVLGRAGAASMVFYEDGTGVLGLEYEAQTSCSSVQPFVLPFNVAADHVFIEGALNDVPVTFLFDTGARSTLIPQGIAEAAGLADGSLPEREFRGLDGNPLPARSVRPESITLGAETLPGFDMYAADLPVLERFGLDEGSGLLGIDFVLGFGRVDVDFGGQVIRMWREAP